MKYLIAMSLFSFLFGCGGKKTPEKPQPWPKFPETDNPAVQIQPVALDSGFAVKSFFIPPDQQSVFALAYRDATMKKGQYEVATSDCRIYRLDAGGQVKKFLEIRHTDWTGNASFGVLDGQLLILLQDCFMALDLEKFAFGEKIPVYDTQFFPSKQDIEMMTFDEQRDGYNLALDAALAKCADCRWLDWTPGGAYFVLAKGTNGKRAAWSPLSYQDEDIEPLKSRFPAATIALPHQENDRIVDGPARIREVEILSAGTQLDYPNYKSRSIVQYELTLGDKTAHFSTTDRSRHALYVNYADNLALATADGAAWVKYEGVLYRMQ